MSTPGASAAAVAAAQQAARAREEEEAMTAYPPEALRDDWEFKCLRSATGAFKNPPPPPAVTAGRSASRLGPRREVWRLRPASQALGQRASERRPPGHRPLSHLCGVFASAAGCRHRLQRARGSLHRGTAFVVVGRIRGSSEERAWFSL